MKLLFNGDYYRADDINLTQRCTGSDAKGESRRVGRCGQPMEMSSTACGISTSDSRQIVVNSSGGGGSECRAATAADRKFNKAIIISTLLLLLVVNYGDGLSTAAAAAVEVETVLIGDSTSTVVIGAAAASAIAGDRNELDQSYFQGRPVGSVVVHFNIICVVSESTDQCRVQITLNSLSSSIAILQ